MSPTQRTVLEAAREFNAGRFFEAHEVLEEGLDDVPGELWDLFLGLIQIAVGYHKVTQELRSGAIRMLELGLGKVARFPADAGGVHLDRLRDRVGSDLRRLRSAGLAPQALAADPPRLQPLPMRE